MVGSRNNSLKRAVLREDLGAAVQIAAELSISAGMRTLSEVAGETRSEWCDAFIRAWHESLSPGEQLSVAMQTFDLYVLDLVVLPGAEETAITRLLHSSGRACESIREALLAGAVVAESPDAGVSPEQAAEMIGLAAGPVSDAAQRSAHLARSIDRARDA